ncbi:hypothetical protein [Hespellia stercorisuis]|uniref:Uncharacterized protein n=1 Tax=Hespellia stercorisuis DSM 15480 TaxID=1121950 RepID=A0A1M6M1P6_9FIRM|nr:hypothetical protein [Hespellia stercorisuis]SHJ77389.1 hypothetical protein SAMN02745243_01346 [Hespellia stercorisuis DSM 15480]
MAEEYKRLMAPFDHLVVSSDLQMIKLLLPFLPLTNQRGIAVAIKFFELEHTMQLYSDKKAVMQIQSLGSPKKSFTDMLEQIRPYLDPGQSHSIDSIMSMLQTMELFKNFDGADMDFGNFPDFSNFSDLFQTFGEGSGDENHEQKGDDADDE